LHLIRSKHSAEEDQEEEEEKEKLKNTLTMN